jgi:hypothetical protein
MLYLTLSRAYIDVFILKIAKIVYAQPIRYP